MAQKKKRTDSTSKQVKKKPVILQVLPELKSGGVERGTVEIAKACVDGGYGSLVASAGGHMVQQLVSVGATHITLPLASKNPLVIAVNIKRLAKIIKDNQVDIVHARSRAPAWSAYKAAQKTGCKFVTTFHGVYSFKNRLKLWYNSVMAKGDRVIAASQFIFDHVLEHYEIPKRKLRLVPRGVDMALFDVANVPSTRMAQMARKLKVEHDSPIILLPGRLTQWKGHEFLLDALALIPHQKYQCLLVGDDKHHRKYRERLNKKIKKRGLAGTVRILGNVQDMPAVYSLADIVVSASLRPEAFGRVAIEAQAMGRLVIATNHGGSCETIIPEKTGWLVTPGDVPALAAAIEKALAMTQRQRKTMANRASKHIRTNFSLQQMVDKTLDVYRELLK